MQNITAIIVLLLVICKVHSQSTLVSPAEFNQLMTDTNIQKLDVRSGVEFNIIGHLPGFVQINVLDRKFESKVKDQLNPAKPILVTCFSGHRSVDAVKILESLGFKNIYELDGGLINWMQKGYKLE